MKLCPGRCPVPGHAREDRTVKYPWIDEYLISKRGVTKDLQPEWNWMEQGKTDPESR